MRTLPLSLALFTLATAAIAAAPLAQRVLWTWDNRMDFGGAGPSVSVMGGGRYTKSPEAFLTDYKALVDYVHDHTSFNAVIIWGFVRDEHGGVAASQELCEYATARGIRIIPGVGTSGYEGYVYSGNHKYNITTWLREHPDLRAVSKEGKPLNALCPTAPENIKWLDDGCRWLFATFKIGGINFEIGDFFVCYCDRCRAARAAIPGDAPDYYKDMALSTAPVARTALSLAPDAWISYATYTGFTPEMQQAPPSWVPLIPPDMLCQWTLTGMEGAKWPVGLRPPTPRNLGYLHWGNKSTHTVHHFYLDRVRSICQRAAEADFEGLVTYGEDPPSLFNMRVFYAAWSAFLQHPDWQVADFTREGLAPWFDSLPEAEKLTRLVLDLERDGLTRQRLTTTLAAAQQAEAAAPVGKAQQTWGEFRAFLQARLTEIEAQDCVVTDPTRLAQMMREGFLVRQETKTTLVLPRRTEATLVLPALVRYSVENGLLPVMRVTFNGTVLDLSRAVERRAMIRLPKHDAYQSLPSYEPGPKAWRVKYDTDWAHTGGGKYETPDYDDNFRFNVGDLWRDGENRLEIENLEQRFRPSDNGVLEVHNVSFR
jgi:hypothetical protein